MHRTEILIRAQTRMKHIQCDSTAWIHSRWSLWHNVCGKYKWLPWKPISSLVRIWRCLWYLPRWRGRWGWLYEISFFFFWQACGPESVIIPTKKAPIVPSAFWSSVKKKLSNESVNQRSFQKHDDPVMMNAGDFLSFNAAVTWQLSLVKELLRWKQERENAQKAKNAQKASETHKVSA